MRTNTPRRPVRTALLVAVAALAATLTATPAEAGPVVTPGDFRGHGFDQCLAPSQKDMNAWLRSSPYLAVGIYISGDSRGCRNQPHLTPRWIRVQLRKGWKLLPITLGPQASCQPNFPRYGNDPTIRPRPGRHGKYRAARRQGRREAAKTVGVAGDLGIPSGSTLWYDLEGFDLGNTRCRESALAFLSAWTNKVHALDYVSGVYSSAGSGIKMLDDARVNRPGKVSLPDAIWIARWDGRANTSTDYIRDDGWLPGGRMKQYRGGHTERWGGVSIDVDSDWLDLGRGMYAPPVEHCSGVDVDHPRYLVLRQGSDNSPEQVRALQCLLHEAGYYHGRLHGRYNRRTVGAAGRWQADHGFEASTTWSRQHWMSLLAAGHRPVLKFGSAGEDVRRFQRALHAARPRMRMPIRGRYGKRVAKRVAQYQASIGQRDTGILTAGTWRALQRGDR